jgi:integrase
LTYAKPNHNTNYDYNIFVGVCMKGKIYCSQKCFFCGRNLKWVEGRDLLVCPDHPKMIWRNNCQVRFGKAHTKRFKTVYEAERHLNYIRVQSDKGSFDQREWAKDQPLSFYSLRCKFEKHKMKQPLSVSHKRHIKLVLNLAGKSWDHLQIKEIAEGEIDDFIDCITVGDKTKKNYVTVLQSFWSWVVRREKRRSGLDMPEFPDIKFKLAWRNILSMEDQGAVLDEIKQLSYHINPRTWLGIKLLSIYPKVRPGEMLNVKEGHINLQENWILFPDPKEGIPKFIHLLPEHSDMIRKIRGPKGLPDLYFFRHLKSRSGVKLGAQFGPKQFRVWWNKACANLGIKGVDLYGGTKHSTVTALGKVLSPEQIQRGATGHVSDAFKRYMLPNINEALTATKAVQKIQPGGDKLLINFFEEKKIRN